MENTSLENEVIQFQLKDNILFETYKVPPVDLPTAESATNFRLQLTRGKKLPAIADISCVKNVDKDARRCFSSNKAEEDLAVLAIIVSNPVTPTLGNFFLKFNRPAYPCRLFTRTEEALTRIQQYV